MTEKEKRQKRAHDEDAVFNRMLLWLVGGIIAEAIALLAKRFYVNIVTTDFGIAAAVAMKNFFTVFAFAGVVLIALGIIWCVLSKKKKGAMLLPGICTALIGFVWLLSLSGCLLGATGVKIMSVMPIAGIVLILIYFLYNRAFFLNAVIAGCGMLVLWAARNASTPAVIVSCVVLWIILIAVSVLAVMLKKNQGNFKKFHVVSDQKSYAACWLSCAVVFILTLLGLILGSAVAYYLLYVLIGWLFCLAVFYTVKMM